MTSVQFAMMAAFYFSLMAEIKTVQRKSGFSTVYDCLAFGFMVAAIISMAGE